MAWRFVRQPNGKLARFSEIVDNFTDYNLSEEQARQLCFEEYGLSGKPAEQKVARGAHDPEGPLARWEEALRIIEMVHGKGERYKVAKKIGSLPVPAHEGLEAPLPVQDMVDD